MQSHRTHYIDPTADIAWMPGGAPLAYLYLLDGQTHMVAHHSLAEQRLLDRGAFPVAVLSFERPAPPLPTRVQSLGLRDAVAQFARADRN